MSDLIPDLALNWELPDPTTYVFHLRHDVRFHDGRPLTSADVKYTFDELFKSNSFKSKAFFDTVPVENSSSAPAATPSGHDLSGNAGDSVSCGG